MNRAIIVGHNGQDGSLLVQSLKKKQYEVLGIGRNETISDDQEVASKKFDITIKDDVDYCVSHFKPSEIYYLAAYHQSSEGSDLQQSTRDNYMRSHNIHVMGLLNFLSAINILNRDTKLFYASSSLVFSDLFGIYQDENTPFDPRCVYGITKAQGAWLCREYRDKHNVFASVGILYNHESHLRLPQFLSSKIIQTAIRIAQGSKVKLELGNLNSRTDWGYAPDYVEAFNLVLNLETAEDFIIASGDDHSVQEFVELAFSYFDLEWEKYVTVKDNLLFRQPPRKIGDSRKLQKMTKWKPTYSFPDFIYKLIEDHLHYQGLSRLINNNV